MEGKAWSATQKSLSATLMAERFTRYRIGKQTFRENRTTILAI